MKIFERDSVAGLVTPASHEVRRHDFSNKTFFVVDFEGFAVENPTDYRVVPGIPVMALVASWFVVCKRVTDATIVSYAGLFQLVSIDYQSNSHGKR